MAGKPGRSGGARAGAGRKKAVRPEAEPTPKSATAESTGVYDDPVDFLMGVMNDPLASPAARLRAAVAAAQYKNTRTKDGGKKEAREKAAGEIASTSRFAPTSPPKLSRVA